MEANDIGVNNITLHESSLSCNSNDRSETAILSDILELINGEMQQQQQQKQQQKQQKQSRKNIRPEVIIIEQPASKTLRFRYECEGRSAGSMQGVNSTEKNKTFPTIEIVGYKGRAIVVVSCVTKDRPYRPHPHKLVGKEGCKKGVCKQEVNSETMRAVFTNLGIQCVRHKDVKKALRVRESLRVDPFKTGFDHKFQSPDFSSVRLCFQVFLESDVRGRFTIPLDPVVSDPIYDKKANSDLVICRLCSCSSTVKGGKEVILLCENAVKGNVSVRFFEEHNGQVIWEGFGDFKPTDVHKHHAIAFRTPPYRTMEIEQPVKVFIQLLRPSDGATSKSLPFDYLPLESDPAVLKQKRQQLGGNPYMHLMKHLKAQELQQQHQQQQPVQHQNDRTDGHPFPLPYAMYNNAYRMPEQTPSPQPFPPSTPYNHNASGTPFLYNMGATGNGNLISSSHQYGMAGGGVGAVGGVGAGGGAGAGGGGGGATTNGTPLNYDGYHQQHHFGSINTFNHMQSPPTQWPSVADIEHPTQNLNQCQPISIKLSNYNVNGILTPESANRQPWNLLSGTVANNYNINNLTTNTQHNQHNYQQQQSYHNNIDAGCQHGAALTAAAPSTSEAPSHSPMNMDNDNSEEFSNLSIS